VRLGGGVAGWTRNTWGFSASWVIGLPRRAGARLHAGSDAEARWWHWDVTECLAGLGRRYRDARFAALPDNPEIRGGSELSRGLADAAPASAPPGCQCQEER
jgi:hypothetical protein